MPYKKGEISLSKAAKYLLSDIQTFNDEFREINRTVGKIYN
ncbi:Ligase-interacting factor 1 (fragment) [Candidatus Cloacimonas acidaminovorans str. Evry]|uniref:Ligase-interacting factor 1 n=1 Tax=Cloacimonas acidaminovorans (strain Evry) TaxID=459349 RepID=B0VFV5_CLOAI